MSSELLAAARFAAHVAGARWADLPQAAVDAAKVFILDTFGVGIAGSTAAGAAALARGAARWGEGGQAAVWGTGLRLPAAQAALVNGFQVHCQEYDCVHEGAVLHPLATLLPAAMALAEREGGVSGRDLILAVAVGSDVSAGLGVASKSGLKFFRPGTSGGFGAAAGAARILGLDAAQTLAALGLQYTQTSGSMQPHVEGSVSLPMQVGFNSRAGVGAADLAAAGLTGPVDIFEGPYGYLRLFEGEWDLAPVLAGLGEVWRVAELSHKPYPAGRATHAAIEGVMALRAVHTFALEELEAVELYAPPVIQRLCGRPAGPGMTPNYARLSTPFVVAKTLLEGEPDVSQARGAALEDAAAIALAQKVSVHVNDVTDPNALVPQHLVVRLVGGRVLEWSCDAMLASPARPLSREQHLRKFRRCWAFAADRLGPPEALIAMVDRLEDIQDVRSLAAQLQPQQ